jgi:tetratricopeptide (TPR) repeat protein
MTLLKRAAFVFFTGVLSASIATAQTKTAPVAPASAVAAATPTTAAVTGPVDHTTSYYHYGLAKLYENEAVQSGRQDLASQAIEQYKLALAADPDSHALANGLSNLYFNLGRVKEAVTSAEAQIKRHPDDVDAHTLLGRTYLRSLGNGEGQPSNEMLQAAIKEYETIETLKPKDLETRLLLGQLYGLNHEMPKAMDQFKAALATDPGSEEAVLSMARLYTEDGDLASAAKSIEAVPEDERSARMNFALAGIDDQLKKPADAVVAYRAVLNADPTNAEANKALAQDLLSLGKTDDAAKVYAQILKADPQNPQALIREAEIERQNGKYEQSLETLKKAEAQVSDNIEIMYNEGLVYDSLGRFDEAISEFKQALTASLPPDGKYTDADKSNRALFLDRLANVYREQGKTADAAVTYKEMSELGGDYQSRGTDATVDAYRDAHDWKGALTAAEAAAKAMPTNHDAQLTYARQLADAGRLKEAVKLAEAQEGTDAASNREVYFTLADMYVRAKRWKDAMAVVDKADAAATKPEEKVFVEFYRGTVYDRQKMYDLAEAELRKALAVDPNSGAVLNYLGYMLADRGVKLDESVSLLKKAVAFDPQNGAYLDSLAWAYYKQGQYELAESYAHKAVTRLGTDPTVLDHLGEIEAKNGKLQAAVSEWEKSLVAYGTSLAPDADPVDVAKVQKKLESARVRLAKLNNDTK